MKKYLALILAGILVLGLVACNNNADSNEGNTPAENSTETTETSGNSKLAMIKESGKLVMGTDANYPPFDFHKMIDGKDQIVGFDILLGEAIAEDLGVELEIQDMQFAAVLAAMETGILDVGIGAISKTEERAKTMDFSDIYFESSHSILVRKEDVGKYSNPEKLTAENARVGVQTATIQEEAVSDIEGIEIISLASVPDLVSQLKSGYIDAMLLENTVADMYAAANDDLAPDHSGEFPGESGIAVAVPKGQEDLLAEINKTIQKLKENGKIDEFYEKGIELSITD